MTHPPIERLPRLTCRRILVGTLFTPAGIMRDTLVTHRGPNYQFEPLACTQGEIHSTAYVSRGAVLSAGAVDSAMLARMAAERSIDAVAGMVAQLAAGPDTIMVGLDGTPCLIEHH